MRFVSFRRPRSSRIRRTALIAAGALVVAGIAPGALATSSTSGAAAKTKINHSPVSSKAAGSAEELTDYDARTDPAVRPTLQRRATVQASKPAVKKLRKTLGVEGIVSVDGLTGTPRKVGKTNGFLTGKSKARPEAIVLSYIKNNLAAFGLSAKDVDRLKLRKAYRDVAGTHHLSFVQSVGGVAVFGNGLKGHVTKDGRLVAIDGSPVANLPAAAAKPKLTAAQARTAAIRNTFAKPKAWKGSGDTVKPVLFYAPHGLRTAYQTVTRPGTGKMFMHVIDAVTGRTLYRRDLVQHDSASVVDHYPGAAKGGTFHTVNLPARWLPTNSPRLAGNVAHVWSDVNDDNIAQSSEEIRKAAPRSFLFPFTRFNLADEDCKAFVCTWDSTVANSWQTNRANSGTQLFFFLGKFHDHLAASPIGFTREAGNFEAVDDDAVQGQDIDGADTADGLPNGNHVDNANMGTPPDGQSPTMQMYLWRDPSFPGDPWVATHGSYDGSIVYHEYTHGLSNRLVVDADGISTLGAIQAGSMGEAWSDWYAMEFLVNDGFITDTAADGDIRVGQYVGAGRDQIRTQPLDCKVGSPSVKCPGTPGAGPGGYTYGDFAKIIGQPEVHADGEIWAETLWDLRQKIGVSASESLVTRAMELSPSNPSFLDMRNSILQADLILNDGAKHKAIWKVFANRGMGFFAGATDGDDSAPAESFSMPPAPSTPTGSLTGKVLSDTGTAVNGAIVGFGGHASGFGGDYAAVTAADGSYTISGIFAGTYPKVFSRGPGYDQVVTTVSVNSGTNTRNWSLRRDWAATSGGSTLIASNGHDGDIFGCGPVAMFDQSQGNGWSTAAVFTAPGVLDPRFATVKLPVAVNIGELSINPSNTCGDGGSASTGDFSVETSPDGTNWTVAATGHFGVPARGHMNIVPLTAGATGVQYIRYTMLGNQVADVGGTCPGPFSGCDWVDSVELAVYGPLATP